MFLLVWPNTYLSQMNISFWPKPLVKIFLENKGKQIVDVKVEYGETKVSYRDLGISLDIDKTMECLEIKRISDLVKRWVFSANNITLIQPVFEFGDDFEKLAEEKFPKRSLINESVAYNTDSGLFDYNVDVRKARVDTVDFQAKLITFSEIKSKPIEIEMIGESSNLEKKIDDINRSLRFVYSKPLDLVVEGINKKIILGQNELLQILDVEINKSTNMVDLSIKKEAVTKLLADNGVINTSADWVTKNIKDNLTQRYSKGELKPVVLGVDSGPNTDGSLANKYIEVDISQQKMYFFENGQLFKEYSVSTGLNYPTPAGSYKIKNKLPMGFSSIFNVWMPWWMAFDYREDIGAYLGIHELPYRLIGGEKIYRFGNYIGSKKTGGCVALAPGDSKEVYDKSSQGMDVFIYQ